MQRWIDSSRARDVVSDETLYLSSGETIKQMSVGLEALVADIYWIRTVQYFGRKLIESGEPLGADTSHIKMDLLAPLLRIIVTLDPAHIPAYRFGAIFLPERDLPSAVELLERGIRENPNEWRLYQDLGYIYWQARDYAKAADWYERGADVPGAQWWMRDLAGLMRIRGGSRETARQVYIRQLESDDQNIRNQAVARLKQLQALDEIDLINMELARYQKETGVCPANLRLLAGKLHPLGLTLDAGMMPVDPDGFRYWFDPSTCNVKVAFESTIPR
jgi:tetratricopeptide (TPR) repeat protein